MGVRDDGEAVKSEEFRVESLQFFIDFPEEKPIEYVSINFQEECEPI